MSIGYNKTKYPNMTQTTYYKPREFEKTETKRQVPERNVKQIVIPAPSPEPKPEYFEPPKVEPEPTKTLVKQEPAGVLVFQQKKTKPLKPKKPKKNQIVYYSSEDEEMGQVKKVYSNDKRFRNYYCLNVCKGRCANCCPFFNCFEWFYGFPLWFYILLILLFIALLVTFFVLLALVLQAPNSAKPVTVTRIYNRTWFLYQIQIGCGGGGGGGGGCTSYSTALYTQGFMSGQQSLQVFPSLCAFLIIIYNFLV